MREALVTCEKSAKDLVRKSAKYFLYGIRKSFFTKFLLSEHHLPKVHHLTLLSRRERLLVIVSALLCLLTGMAECGKMFDLNCKK